MGISKTRAFMMLASGILLTVGLALPGVASATVPDVNELVSISSSGTQGNQESSSGSTSAHALSGDGRYVVFTSLASNLVSSDTNSATDVFVRDRTNDTTTLVSVSSSGVQSNGYSDEPAISYDGRYVVFESNATNLVTGVTNGYYHIYRHNMNTGTTTIVDANSGGTAANSNSDEPDVSADGRFIVFNSMASNLVSGINPTGVGAQIFIKDMSTGAVEALSVNGSGTEGNASSTTPTISCDGNVVAFASGASNLVTSDTNGYGDVFVDTLGWSGNSLTDVTLSGNASSDFPSVSCNGNDVAYETAADNLASSLPSSSESVLEYNRLSGSTSVASSNSSGTPASGYSTQSSVSDDGRYVVFNSTATTGLDSGRSYDTFGSGVQTFVKDMKSGATQVISIDTGGNGVSGSTDAPSISPDGSLVAYDSVAKPGLLGGDPNTGLVSTDSNGYQDVFDSETGF